MKDFFARLKEFFGLAPMQGCQKPVGYVDSCKLRWQHKGDHVGYMTREDDKAKHFRHVYATATPKVNKGIMDQEKIRAIAARPPMKQKPRARAHWDEDAAVYIQAGAVQAVIYGEDVVQYQDVYESPSKTSGYDGNTITPEQSYGSSPSFSEPSMSYSSSSDSSSSYSSSSSDSGGSYSSGE
jgi:hypothetical protein